MTVESLPGSWRAESRAWWQSLAVAPDPLSRRQRSWFLVTAIAVALSRLLFISASPWDWDEMLFSLGVRQFDVMRHHPHPPGFPLFIGLAKVLVACGMPVFRALQTIDIAGGLLLVPAMFAFCRALRFRYSTSLVASLFLAFFPNVWFFGETAFSDVPAVVLAVAACALLLRGCRSDRAYIGGALLLGVAAAFRPQNLVIGLIPALIATWFRFRARRWLSIAVACLAGAAVVASSYGAAIELTGGWQRYDEALKSHQQYITSVDSFRNPNRPPLLHLFDDFYIRPYHAPLINAAVTALVAISLIISIVRLRWGTLVALASFGPFSVAAWLILDHFSASRFSIGYAPLMALLAADGVTLVATVSRDARTSRRVETLLAAALTIGMVVWTVPALALTSGQISPPAQAMAWIRGHVPPSSRVCVHEKLLPYSEWFLPDYKLEWFADGAPIATLDDRPRWYVSEETGVVPGLLNFNWTHGRAWNVARRRYFDVSITRLDGAARFSDSWYSQEADGRAIWRWLARHGRVDLPPISGPARLNLRLFAPLHVLRGAPVITIRMNGAVARQFALTQPLTELSLDFSPRGRPAVLEIETDRTVNPKREKLGHDDRDLGLRVDRLEWIAVEK